MEPFTADELVIAANKMESGKSPEFDGMLPDKFK